MSIQRSSYLNNEASHAQYYNQFIDQPLRDWIVSSMGGIDILKKAYARDSSLNTIPLSQWDTLAYTLNNPKYRALFVAAGDFWTLGGAVCILKQAATLEIECS